MNRWIRAYWAVTTVVVLTIAGQALLGHIAGIAHYYQWRNGSGQVGMAICIALLGGAIGARLFWKEHD